MAVGTQIPKGTRDFGPKEMIRRNYIFDTIRGIFKKYGYLPIETPAMEQLSTLMGKYGDEGDRLLYKIINSGNFLSKVDLRALENSDPSYFSKLICEKGLRYDLTVPFARFVVQHRNEISFPFKRYQIQPVWRADRPQKGRYREFYQCDADVIGSNSIYNEFELIQIVAEVFSALGIANEVKLNNRKILAGIAEQIGENERITDITVAIDKVEKIGIDGVNNELEGKNISSNAIIKLQTILNIKGANDEKLAQLSLVLKNSNIGLQGIDEMKLLLSYLKCVKLESSINLDLTLARGLNYYTGTIIEVKASDYEIGSICGGGRYDDLTGVFGLNDVSGVGISFGADRIYDVMKHLDVFSNESIDEVKVLFLNFGEKEEAYSIKALAQIRNKGIPAELYPDTAKLKKQMSYANTRNIPFVVFAGEEEMKSNEFTLKDMQSGEQSKVDINALMHAFSK